MSVLVIIILALLLYLDKFRSSHKDNAMDKKKVMPYFVEIFKQS